MRIEVSGGTLVVSDGADELVRASGEVLLSDGRGLSTQQQHGLEWRVEGTTLCLAYRNEESRAVGVQQLRPLVAPRGYRGLPLDRLRIASTGWQSWSRSNPPLPFAGN
ncbi:MAG: hypothetical protein M3336_07615, partial [Chloroflexota bacterium]|nr:hypothetical protein [Chloroflexota bacterium]